MIKQMESPLINDFNPPISANDLRINSETLLKANQALNDELGLAIQYDTSYQVNLMLKITQDMQVHHYG